MGLYNASLGLTESEFQRDAIYYAGKNMQKNVTVVEMKASVVSRMTWMFFLELGLMFIRVARA